MLKVERLLTGNGKLAILYKSFPVQIVSRFAPPCREVAAANHRLITTGK
jgi:hypothetical protein